MTAPALQLTRFIKATPQRVFAAFTEPRTMAEWFGPRGCTCPSIALDVRVGGRYRVEMHGDDSGGVMVLSGEYREVRPPERLVFTWQWAQGEFAGVESVVSVTFEPRPGGTELRVQHAGLQTPQAVEAHGQGWQSSLECLDDAIAGRAKQPVAQPLVLGDPRSTYVRSVRLALAEKGIAYRLEPHSPRDEAVAAIHPFHRIPAYRQGPFELYEASAILRYVDETLPGPSLLPDTPAERARMEQWISVINAYCYDAMVRRVVLQYVIPRGAEGKPDRGVIDKALPEVAMQLGVFERAYGEREHLVGDRPSLADLLLAPIVFYLGLFPDSRALLERHPAVQRGHAAMVRRPSFAATLPPLG